MFRKLTRPEPFAIAILIAVTGLATWPTAEAQLGRGGFGGGAFRGIDGYMVERSQSGKSLYGYSEKTGSWDKLTVEPHTDDGLNAVQSTGVAALRGQQAVHAFGPDSGKWATVATDGNPSPVVVSAAVAACVAGDRLYAFGSSSDDWAVAELGERADATKLEVGTTRVVYRTDTHIHVFSNASGNWASVDLTED